jgi:hypothetical protein
MRLLAVLQTDCPTCQLIVPYLNRMAAAGAPIAAISQDPDAVTAAFARQMEVSFPLDLDPGYRRSIELDVVTVPTLFLIDDQGNVERSEPGFDKGVLNELAEVFGLPAVALDHDGAPASKPGCSSRHLEVQTAGESAPALEG